jgi:hypothetical protein
MDMAFEYRKHFGPIPDTMSWHEVLAGARRVRAFEIRERLIAADGAAGFGRAGHNDGLGQMLGKMYERQAFPEFRNAERDA